MAPDRYLVETQPDPKDVAFLQDRIIEYNCHATGFYDGEALAIFLRDETGEIKAGLSGFSWGGTCKVEWLWVHEELRGQGIGRDLMNRAEEEAVRRGCARMVVDTHSFQAPGFYQKLGFQIAGVYTDFPKGHQQIFLGKALPSSPRQKTAP